MAYCICLMVVGHQEVRHGKEGGIHHPSSQGEHQHTPSVIHINYYFKTVETPPTLFL